MRFYFRMASKISGVNAANNILCNSRKPFIVQIFIVKPLPNGLASRRKSLPSFRLVSDLRFVWPPTCVNLRWLALTWSTSNSYASRRKFFTVWPPNANQHKWIARHLYKRKIYDLRELTSRLANPFGHPSQVRTQVLFLQTSVEWAWRGKYRILIGWARRLLTLPTCYHIGESVKTLRIPRNLNTTREGKIPKEETCISCETISILASKKLCLPVRRTHIGRWSIGRRILDCPSL